MSCRYTCLTGYTSSDVTFDRYDFDSWREFSYLDEENLESAQRSAVSSARELYRLLILMKYVGQKVFKWGGGEG